MVPGSHRWKACRDPRPERPWRQKEGEGHENNASHVLPKGSCPELKPANAALASSCCLQSKRLEMLPTRAVKMISMQERDVTVETRGHGGSFIEKVPATESSGTGWIPTTPQQKYKRSH